MIQKLSLLSDKITESLYQTEKPHPNPSPEEIHHFFVGQ